MVGPRIRDAELEEIIAMPTADGTVSTAGIDLGAVLSADDYLADASELMIVAPALNTTMLPDADTATYKLEMDDDVAFGSAVDVYGSDVLVQTGAGAAGAAAATKRVRLPSDGKRYVRLTCTLAGTTGDASAVDMELRLLT